MRKIWVGKRYGRLVVIHYEPGRGNLYRNLARVVCKCDCGNVVDIVARALYTNHSLSCGCLKRDWDSRKLSIRSGVTCKTCSRCKEEKPLEQFHKHLNASGKRQSLCKVCTKITTLERRYGVTPAHYERLLKVSNGKCQGCNKLCRRLQLDHCAKSGKVRGLLCGKCNRALGLCDHDPGILRGLAEYLDKPRRTHV
jgi:hypothetical protein